MFDRSFVHVLERPSSDDPLYLRMEYRVPALAERAERIIDGEEPL